MRNVALLAPAALLAVALFAALQPSETQSASTPNVAPAARHGGETHAQTRYRLEFTQSNVRGGSEHLAFSLSGEWRVEDLGGRTRITLAEPRVQGPGAPSGVAGALEYRTVEGAVAEMGFETESRPARRLLTMLAVALHPTQRSGATWTVTEADDTGPYEAHYTRTGRTLDRRLGPYLAVRTERGPSPAAAEGLSVSGGTRFDFDAEGLRAVDLERHLRFPSRPGEEQGVRVTASLRRIGVGAVGTSSALGLAAIGNHIDYAAEAHRHELELLDGADLPELLSEMEQVLDQEPRTEAASKQRNRMSRRLAALLRGGGEAQDVIEATRARIEDRFAVSMLVGGLSQANTAEATNALVDLLQGGLPRGPESTVYAGLALTKAPTLESLTALHEAAEQGQPNAALAMGAQARKLRTSEPEATADAVQNLLEQYAAASEVKSRQSIVLALANSGDRRALPIMQAELAQGMAELGAYGLRFIPGADVDALLDGLLQTSGPVMLAALQAVSFRDPQTWRPRLQAARSLHSEAETLQAIDAALARLG